MKIILGVILAVSLAGAGGAQDRITRNPNRPPPAETNMPPANPAPDDEDEPPDQPSGGCAHGFYRRSDGNCYQVNHSRHSKHAKHHTGSACPPGYHLRSGSGNRGCAKN